MNIYNLEIHKQCGLYSLPEDGSIKIMDRKEETEVLFLEEKLTYSKLLFVLEGKVKLKINKLEVQVVGPGNVALVPCNSYLIASVEPGSYLLMVNFTEKEPFCSRYSLVNLMHDADSVEDSSRRVGVSLPINERIKTFVDSVVACMDDGISNSVYFNIKKQELFLLMLSYYDKNDLAEFFYPLFCFNRKFEQLVMSNYENVTDVKHFAALLHMPVTTFQRKFKKHFKTSVKQWLLDRKAESMLSDIKTTNRSITDLSKRYGFSSVSYFSNFCKHYFGKTPTELRAEGNLDD